MQHLETCLLPAEADTVFCHLMIFFNCPFPLDLQNEILLLSILLFMAGLLLGFWLKNALLVKVTKI